MSDRFAKIDGKRWIVAVLTLSFIALMATSARAQSEPRFVRLSGKAKDVLYMPDSAPPPHIGILLMHEDSNFIVHIACTEFAKRRYAVMCVNGRSDNNEALDYRNDLTPDAALGMRHPARR